MFLLDELVVMLILTIDEIEVELMVVDDEVEQVDDLVIVDEI